MNALHLHELEEMPEQEERERFRIETIDQVNWALRKLSAIETKRTEIEQLAQAEIERIQAWKETELKKLQDDAWFFSDLLHDYAFRQREKDPNWKKASTPYGVVKFKKLQPKWRYDDEKLLESLKSVGRTDLIRVKEEPNKAELKKVAVVQNGKVIDPETGAPLDGVYVEEQSDTVVIDL